ncbi:MAG: cytochrome c biogenesis protein ResB [Desulfatitalea sp.]
MDNPTTITPGYAHSLWRFLSSLKLTVVLLFCMAALSVFGTVIPQNFAAQEYVRLYGVPGYRLLVLLDLVDMYRSWWFVGLMLLLVVNIIVCSIDRLSGSWRVIFVRQPKFDLAQYRQRKNRLDFQVQAAAGQLKEPFQRFMAKRFRFCRLESTERGFVVTAERGRWTRLGVYGVHLSIVVLLVGGLIGSKFGFEGFVAIPEGDKADTIQLNRSDQSIKLPFAIRCDDFSVTFYEGGQRPKEFRSQLTIVEEDREVLRQEIVVNAPLHYKGIGIYQSSYGRLDDDAPPANWGAQMPAEIELAFRSTASGIIYTLSARIGQPLQIPEGMGQLVLERYEQEAMFQSMALGPALIGTLTDPQATPQIVTLPLKFPKFDAMRGGTVTISVNPPKAPPQPERFYTGLQVVYDPGVGVVYVGFILMLVGCTVAFFMSHQQVVVEVVAQQQGCAVMVSGKSNKNQMGLQMQLQRMADRLAGVMMTGSAGKTDR